MGNLRILAGGAKTGKSRRIYEELSAARNSEVIVLVPEQNTHFVTREVCAICGDESAMWVQVLSFTDLSRRVFEQCGGTAVNFLSDGGRLLLMNRTLEKLKDVLNVYSGSGAKTGTLNGLLTTVEELKSCGVTAAELSRLCDRVDFGDKLGELAAICETYDALSKNVGLSPSDRLTFALDKMASSDIFSGARVYVDGFSDFTHLELEILSLLMQRAESMTVALTVEENCLNGAFSLPESTMARLLSIAKRTGCAGRVERIAAEKEKPLRFLAENLFGDTDEKYEGECESIALTPCENAYEECLLAAEEIAKLISCGARYRDFTVVVRDVGAYRALLENAFEMYNIPLFVSGSRELEENPVYALITAALDTVKHGFEYEDMFRFLKTGLAGITPDERDVLENYVLKWNIKGSLWWREEQWSFNPDGYGIEFDEASSAELRKINGIRELVRRPFVRLRESFMAASAATEYLSALYDFLTDISLPENLDAAAERFTQKSQLRRAEDYEKMWQCVVSAMDQCAAIIGDGEMEMREFCEIFAEVLACECVNTIPVSIDRVQLTEISRTGHTSPKYLLLLGANDNYIPMPTSNAGVITEQERRELLELGLSIQSGEQTLLLRELYSVYCAFSAPTEKLFISWSKCTDKGDGAQPSFVVERISELFPTVSPKGSVGDGLSCLPMALRRGAWELRDTGKSPTLDALESVPALSGRVRRIRAAAEYTRGSLTKQGVEELYGGAFNMSASKIDKFNFCRFAYFMQYGLKAKPRKAAKFEAPEMGTFVHEILENTARDVEKRGGFKSVEQDKVRKIAKKHVKAYIENTLGNFKDKTPRFKYLFNRLLTDVYAIVDDMAAELRVSQFRPMEFELEFGGKGKLPPVVKISDDGVMRINGFVDRVDGWEKDGRLYLRVVDYKTGRKSFKLTDIANGLGLQMLIYLFALTRSGSEKFDSAYPAGVLYVPARTVVTKGRISDEERVRQTAKELRRSGVVLDDEDVLTAMEEPENGRLWFLPVNMKNGVISGDALITAEQFGKLSNHIDSILAEMTSAIAGGDISAQPFVQAQQSPCDYCEFKAACLYDERSGCDMQREIKTVKSNEFWLMLDEKEAERE